MPFNLDNNYLISAGLGDLPVKRKNEILAHIYSTLEMRVGAQLADKMTNEQLDEFEAFITRKDQTRALNWLENNFPDYRDVVAEQLAMLTAEITASAPDILAAERI